MIHWVYCFALFLVVSLEITVCICNYHSLLESVFYYVKQSFKILLLFRSLELPQFLSIIVDISSVYIENHIRCSPTFCFNRQIRLKKPMKWGIVYYIYPYFYPFHCSSFFFSLKFPVFFCYYFLSVVRTLIPAGAIWTSQCHWVWVSENTKLRSLCVSGWRVECWACWHSRCQQIRFTSFGSCGAGGWVPIQATLVPQ